MLSNLVGQFQDHVRTCRNEQREVTENKEESRGLHIAAFGLLKSGKKAHMATKARNSGKYLLVTWPWASYNTGGAASLSLKE